MVSVNYTLNIEILRKFIIVLKSPKKRIVPVSFKCLLLITLQFLGPKKNAALLVIFFANFKVIATLRILSGRKPKKTAKHCNSNPVKAHRRNQISSQKFQYSIINDINYAASFIIKL